MNYPSSDRAVKLELSFPVPKQPHEALTLSQKIAYLLSDDHNVLPGISNILQYFDEELPKVIDLAFNEENSHALLEVHKTLYLIYEANFSHPLSAVCSHQNSSWLLSIRNKLEANWLHYELEKIQEFLPSEAESLHPHSLCRWFAEEAARRSNTDQRLLKFLRDEASVEQFNLFILADAPLNYRFFDSLALAQIYFSESVKAEIVNNIWDECGQGIAGKSHTQQFTSMLTALDLELPSFPVWEDWRPYSGYNLYFCFGLSRRYYFRAIGSLAMPELFDPSRNRSVVIGLERLFSNPRKSCEYFYNHIETDEEHGSRWLNHIIFSLAEAQPEAGMELAIGGTIRMEAMRRYNEYLVSRFELSN